MGDASRFLEGRCNPDAPGEVPTGANLNIYGGSGSCVRWHSDDVALFGDRGNPKLIVSLGQGSSVLFNWKPRAHPDSDESSCWLHHENLLVMDGCCQDEYLHRAVLRLGGGRAGGHHLSVAQEPLASVSLGTGGRVWPASVRHGLTRFYQRGFGLARDFGSGVSGGSYGVGAALCSGPHFFRARVASVCLVVGPSFGWFPALALKPSPCFGPSGANSQVMESWGERSGVHEDTPGTSALVELPSPLSYDTYLEKNLHGAPSENNGEIDGENSFPPFGVFLASHNPLMRFGKKMLCGLGILDRA